MTRIDGMLENIGAGQNRLGFMRLGQAVQQIGSPSTIMGRAAMTGRR